MSKSTQSAFEYIIIVLKVELVQNFAEENSSRIILMIESKIEMFPRVTITS